MHVSRVVYQLRRNLGDYSHEDLTVEVASTVEDNHTGDQMMTEAKRICHGGTTKAQATSKPAIPSTQPQPKTHTNPLPKPTGAKPQFVAIQDPKDGLVYMSSVETPGSYLGACKARDWKTANDILRDALPGYEKKKMVSKKGTNGKWYVGYTEWPSKHAASYEQPEVNEEQTSIDLTGAEDDSDNIPF